MAQIDSFDGEQYFTEMAKANKLVSEKGFVVGKCTGWESLGKAMAEFRNAGNFVLVDDSYDGTMFSNKVGRFMHVTYVVFILSQYKWDDLDERHEKLAMCRRIYRQFLSKMLRDRKEKLDIDGMDFMHLDNMYYKELGRFALHGVTGLYFMCENDEPVDLTYDGDEWQ